MLVPLRLEEMGPALKRSDPPSRLIEVVGNSINRLKDPFAHSTTLSHLGCGFLIVGLKSCSACSGVIPQRSQWNGLFGLGVGTTSPPRSRIFSTLVTPTCL